MISLAYLNALQKISGVGPRKTKKLLNYFDTAENVWQADLSQLIASGVGEKLAEKIILERRSINPQEEWEKLEKENIKIITPDRPDFPKLLKETPNPPYILYAKGQIETLKNEKCLAIVGSRKFTSYGAQIAQSLARDLADAGITIVSGMAIGIDTFAHQGALEASGKTIAVLGNSLDDASIYPRVNFNLSKKITISGVLLSEYPPETPAGPLTFPARNRIIAGLSLGTLVVEAGEDSGALITAQMALDYNREVFSVPGSIFSSASAGTNSLIRNGAKVVTGINDILEELNLEKIKSMAPKNPENETEKRLLEILSAEPVHVDIILKLTKLNMSQVNSTLSMMEIKGWVKNIGGQNYILI